MIQIHTTLISYIAKRLTAYEMNKNKKAFKSGMSFFRALVPLLLSVQSRNALEMYVAKLSDPELHC